MYLLRMSRPEFKIATVQILSKEKGRKKKKEEKYVG